MSEQLEYAVIFHTNNYAGNFSREMCAYITGIVGECEVGYRQAEEALEEIDDTEAQYFSDHVVQKPDDNGCYRPCAMTGDPDYHDVEIYFDIEPTKEIFELMFDRAKSFCIEKGISLHGVSLEIKKTVTTKTTKQVFTNG